ncbi:MAG: 2,3-bisphosphoglycerate-independent phosphoglycerate mutase [Rhodospirillaceae bacterium]|nr:2,3-bisphosphoglycerate-independent phosphoglycerate mutase [Rhodospirillaceae bacterium]
MSTAPSFVRPTPLILCILDGWGHRTDPTDNAIALAHTPNWDRFLATYPHALVETSGLDVGLPTGQMGNSEVGHMNIGAGRVMMQELPRIDAAVADGSLGTNPKLQAFIATLKKSGGTAHILGLISPGGVHSHQDHVVALAKAISDAGVPVRIHAFLDGRDTPPQSGAGFMEKFVADLKPQTLTQIATVGGRYYGMDRDKRWDRVEKAYLAITEGQGPTAADPLDAIRTSYDAKVTDEFMIPVVMPGYAGMKDGDGVLMGNFRADRARQILTALLDPNFDGLKRPRVIRFAAATGLTEYSSALAKFMTALYTSETPKNVLGEVLANAGLKQLRIAETEKYAHVTFFLNGGVEAEFPGESRILVPSPKVATYDLQPEMSAADVTGHIVEAVQKRKYDVIIVNYANGDMVGHTGILPAAIKAAETIDACLGQLESAVKASGGMILVSADHGNLELMRDHDTGQPHTQHTVGVVPVVLVNPPAGVKSLKDGKLADLAPTVLSLMGLAQPAEMTGHSLASAAAAVNNQHRATA